MKRLTTKSIICTALAVLLSIIFCLSSLADTVYVMKSARVYQKPSTSSKASQKLPVGTELELVAVKNGWAMVQKNGITGYMKASVLAEITEYSGETVYTKSKVTVYKQYTTSSKKLGTLPAGAKLQLEATAGDWALIRMDGRSGFVKKSCLTNEAPKAAAPAESVEKVNMTLYVAEDSAKAYRSYSTSSDVVATLALNTAVKVTAVRGDWCRVESGKAAAFMKKSALSTSKTEPPKAEPTPAPVEPKKTEAPAPAKGKAKEMDWWTSGIQSIFARETVAKVTDVETGISWRVIRKGGSNHADVQPLTAEDTAAMKRACGSWSWSRRAIWVTINGVNYAASMNCMPHGSGSIKDNNFNGHHCIHFTNSRTHGGNKVCSLHQAAIKKAAAASL